jgi:transcriptional regulator with XRE-family HTH domain
LFFTPEMGARLRELRTRKGLTQDEVAERVGLHGKGRWNLIGRLEKGRIGNPSLGLITFYLRACGALFSEFYDTLTRVELIPIDATPIRKTEFAPDRKERIIEQTTKQVNKYQSRTEYPLVAAPMKPEKQRKAAEGFRQYRIQLNIIEQAVEEMLEQEVRKAWAEHVEPKVKYFDYSKYKILARHYLSVLRKYGKPGIQPHSESSPRRAKLEEKMDEVVRYVGEQRLDERSAEMVRVLVVERYERLTAFGRG